jgi:DNA-binding transcriptional LysR family regulator
METMDLDPRRLLVLQAVAESGSLAEAARLLGHTPSAISQQLSRLEREAGTTLTDRTSGRLELTAAGRVLARSGDRISRSLADAERELTALSGQLDGPVTVGAQPGTLASFVVTVVPALKETWPSLNPRIVEVGLDVGLRQLRVGDLDVLIVTDDRDTAVPLPPGCVARVLIEDEYRVAVPDTWQGPLPTTPGELSGKPWISASPTSARGRAFTRLAVANGIVPSVEHVAIHPFSLQAMAAGRLGAVICPRYFVDKLENVLVTEVPVPGHYLVRMIHRGTPASEAVVKTVSRLALAEAERVVATGEHPREVIVKRLPDPSED